MQIKFYKMKYDHRVVKKDLIETGTDPDLIKTTTGDLKDDCMIEKPRIELLYDEDLIDANYMYIPKFKRYYFITNKTLSTQRIFIEAEVDVLNTYWRDIINLKCVVARQEQKQFSNVYLNDGMWRNLQPKDVVTVPFPSSLDGHGSYILAVGGES